MMLQLQYQINLKQSLKKILHIYPAYNDTFVVLAIKFHRTETLAHIDINGNVIKEKLFYDADLEELAMITDRVAVLLHPKQNLIIQWNIQTNQKTQTPFLFVDEQLCELSELIYFPITHCICIAESGTLSHNLLKLSYFKYPLSNFDQPFAQIQSQQAWNYTNIVRKGNNHSMVCVVKIQFQKEPKIKIFKLNENKEIDYVVYNVGQCQFWKQSMQSFQISVSNIWQIRPEEFILVCMTNEQFSQAQDKYPGTNFVFNCKQKAIRRAFFNLPGKFENQHLDSLCFGQTSMIRSYDFQKGQAKLSPVFYIDNQSQTIIEKSDWKCTYLTKYELIGSNPNCFIECEYQNGNVQHIKIKIKQIKNRKMMISSFMTSIIKDCDEDLLQRVIELVVHQ